MKKLECYSYLFEIRDSKNLNIDEYVKETASSGVSSNVLRFINENLDVPYLSVYNEIYSKRHKNKMFKSLVNENQTRCQKAIALSSYVTRALIKVNLLGEDFDDVDKLMKDLMIDEVIQALRDYSNGIDNDKIDEVFGKIRDIFKKLYPEKGDE